MQAILGLTIWAVLGISLGISWVIYEIRNNR